MVWVEEGALSLVTGHGSFSVKVLRTKFKV